MGARDKEKGNKRGSLTTTSVLKKKNLWNRMRPAQEGTNDSTALRTQQIKVAKSGTQTKQKKGVHRKKAGLTASRKKKVSILRGRIADGPRMSSLVAEIRRER